ncbi:MAG: type 4a pilus biogenesis protein PilO [Deltaproteobacteria bacterium]
MAIKINIDVIMKLPLPKRLGVLAAINVVIIGLLAWFLLIPKYQDIRKLRVQLSELNVKLNESRLIAADIPKFQQEMADLETRHKEAVSQLPNEKEIPDLIESISDAGRSSGLKIDLFKPQKEVKRGFYAEVPVNMIVEGKYESLYNFSIKIGALPRIVNIGNLDITSLGHKNRIPMLKANFVTTTFRFLSATESGPPPEAEKKK